MTAYYHIPVLLEEIIALFRGRSLRVFVDATIGAGGHTKTLLQEHPELERVVAFDQDATALAIAKESIAHTCIVEYVESNFCHLREQLQKRGIFEVDALLFDLGVSSMQLDMKERGMSFMHEAPLDMRMSQEAIETASDIVNSFREEDLAKIFYEYGEEFRSRAIAKAIVQARRKKRIETTKELADTIAKTVPFRGKTHPATKVFQALRIAVNCELDVLKTALPQALDLLAPGGRLAVISFHSLEDRIVKQTFAACCKENASYTLITKKPLAPSYEEICRNRRCRSAKLRCIQKN